MKRPNFKLIWSLVGIAVFSGVGVHLLHGYQLGRNAHSFRVQAEKAREEGNLKEAAKQYNQYLKHRDDPEAYSALAEIIVEIASDEGATRQEKYNAYKTLEEAIRRHPDLDDVRRRLIDYTMTVGRWSEALEHIQYLFDHGAKGADLDFKMAKCYYYSRDEEKAVQKLYEVVGYDEKSEQFASQPPPGAQEPSAFELLAQILRTRSNGAKLADALMTQLVAWNDSAKAHLARAAYLVNVANTTELKPNSPEFEAQKADVDKMKADAKAEMDRAFKLDPDDPDVIIAAAVYAISEEDYAKAKELLDRARQEHPDRQDVYLRLSDLEIAQKNFEKAAEQLTLGLKKASEVNAILERLIELQFRLNDIDAVRETFKQMQERGTFAADVLRWEEGRIQVALGNYLEAAQELEAARPAFLRANPRLALQLDLLLGQCYEILGQWDREIELYRAILQKYPDLLRARLGEVIALQNLGKHEQAAMSLNLLANNARQMSAIRPQVLQLLINDQLHKAQDERDWSIVEAIASKLYEDESRAEIDNMLLKADLLMVQNKSAEAQKALVAACRQHPKEPKAWVSLARELMHEEDGMSKLPSVFARAEKEVGDIMLLRLERIRAVLRKGGDDAGAELAKLEKGIDKFDEREQLMLMMQLGGAYLQVRDFASAKRCWKKVSSADPKNSVTRQFMFELAFDTKDEAGMRETLKDLRDSRYFGPTSPLYKYCAAAALVGPVNQRRQSKPGDMTDEEKKALAEARKLIDEAIAMRSEWHPLWRVRGEIDQLEGNVAGAINNYQRALEFSPAGQANVAQRLVKLLYSTNRVSEANDVLKYVGQVDSSDAMERTIEDTLFRGGKQEEALVRAKKRVETEPDNPLNYIWYGQFLERVGQAEEAEGAYRKAVELGPEMAMTWDSLVRSMVTNKKTSEAPEVVREAATALAKNPTALARLYERVGDRTHAEHFYKTAIEEHPGDLPAMKSIVEFYINGGQSQAAIPYLDDMIEKAAKTTEKSDAQMLSMARRFKAQVLASAGDYQHVVEATRLIEQNAKAGVLSPEDTQAVVSLLAVRPEAESRAKATALLENLQTRRTLQPREQSILGQLYERSGKWDKGRNLLQAAITRKGDDLDILFPFAQMLIRHGEFDDAAPWVDHLEELLAKAPINANNPLKQSVTILRARLMVHNGQKEEAIALLDGLLPRPVPPTHLRLLEDLAKLLEELQLYDAAEKLLTEYVAQEPRGVVAMASFYSRRGDVDKAFSLLEQARKSETMKEILVCGVDAMRRNPQQATNERFALLEGWAKIGMEEEANPQQVKLLLAEIYDLQGRTQDAANIYREMLANPQSGHVQKALVKNNLSFMLSISKMRPDSGAEALRLVDEAIRVLGPTADLLDTRALAYLAQGKVEQAIPDLRASIADSPSSGKYFHLAQAEMQAKNRDAARDALAKAQKIGIEVGQFGPIEQKLYAQLVDQLK